jgi:hypothetical protein
LVRLAKHHSFYVGDDVFDELAKVAHESGVL